MGRLSKTTRLRKVTPYTSYMSKLLRIADLSNVQSNARLCMFLSMSCQERRAEDYVDCIYSKILLLTFKGVIANLQAT